MVRFCLGTLNSVPLCAFAQVYISWAAVYNPKTPKDCWQGVVRASDQKAMPQAGISCILLHENFSAVSGVSLLLE